MHLATAVTAIALGCGAKGDKYLCRATRILDAQSGAVLYEDSDGPVFAFTVQGEADLYVQGRAENFSWKTTQGTMPLVTVAKVDGQFDMEGVNYGGRVVLHEGACKFAN